MKAAPFILCVLLCSCSSVPSILRRAHPATAMLATYPTGQTLKQTGDVQIPAKTETVTDHSEIPLPAGTGFTVFPGVGNEAARVEFKLASASAFKTDSVRTMMTAPVSFAPPAPPSVRELANADGVRNSYYFAGGLVLLAAFLAYTGHGKGALIAAAGAIAVPMLANFSSSEWAMRVALCCAVGAGIFFLAYHLMHASPEISELKARLVLAERGVMSRLEGKSAA